ncbi:hypothetical protein D3C75_1168430 [compost metagenome]
MTRQPFKHLHRTAGVVQISFMHKDVNQQGGNGIQAADKQARQDDDFNKCLATTFDVVNVNRHGFRATRSLEYPRDNP